MLIGCSLFACSVDDSKDDELVPYIPKFPFEALDQTNFNNASSVLSMPSTNIRLDSVVYVRYYRFNPELGTSDYQWKSSNQSQASGPPPPEPTSRRSEHFNYNENNQLNSIHSYSNYDYEFADVDLSNRGELQYIRDFQYDSLNNLVVSGYLSNNDSEEIINPISYVYDSSNTLTKVLSNGWTKTIEREKSQLIVKNFSETNELVWTSFYFLDQFKNIDNFIFYPGTMFEFKGAFFYIKNIFNPFTNLFPNNFYSFLVLGENEGGFSHFSSYDSVKYYKEIQVNSKGFPEVVQNGSYDNGSRTYYYYSTYN